MAMDCMFNIRYLSDNQYHLAVCPLDATHRVLGMPCCEEHYKLVHIELDSYKKLWEGQAEMRADKRAKARENIKMDRMINYIQKNLKNRD